jgi:hypothetical protein
MALVSVRTSPVWVRHSAPRPTGDLIVALGSGWTVHRPRFPGTCERVGRITPGEARFAWADGAGRGALAARLPAA